MNPDQGVIYVVLKHFTDHLHPRAIEIESELDAGLSLSEAEIDHISQVLAEARLMAPLIERNPEYRELAERVIAMYASIARRARQNEASPAPGASTEAAGRP
jgi:hypothetical protein